MLHEELNLKLKNLRNLRNLKYLKKLKEKTLKVMKLKNFKKLKKRSEMLENTLANEVFSNVHSWKLACNLLSLENN
jgi:hypothetical protein